MRSRRAGLLGGILLLLVSLPAGVCWGEQTPPPRTVATAGESIVYVTPDEVIVQFGVETFGEALDKAKGDNDAQSARLVKAIAALGVEKKDLQTDNLQVEVEYKGNHPYEGIRGYIARRGYSVKLRDTKLFEKLVDAALKNGANQVNGFEFRTTELRKYRDQARSMAIKAAKEKAVALAADLACGIGKPQQIAEGYEGYFGGYNLRMNAMAQNSMQSVPAGGGGEGEETLPLGQIAVRAQVNVTFELTDK
jgi:uncharacterized protein YggE